MKGIVADLVVGTHGENGLPGRLECSHDRSSLCAERLASPASAIRSFGCQTCRELLPDGLRDR